MKNYKTITRIASIFLVLLLALASLRWTLLVAAQGATVEIENITHYAGNTDVYTNKKNACIKIKRKSTGETWKGTTDDLGRLVINTGTVVGKEDLEASEADDCPGTNQESDSSAILNGVVTVALDTAEGKVNLTLPADMRAGDIISGTVEEDSARRTHARVFVLNGAVFDVAGQQYHLRDRVLTFAVPAGFATLPIILRNSSGRELARSQAQVNQHGQQSIVPSRPQSDRPIVPPRPDNFPPTPPGNFHPPRVGQTGRDITIPGSFDGVADTTRVSIDNQPAKIVAENPRATFAKVPANASLGPTTLTVVEDQELLSLVDLEVRQLLEKYSGVPTRTAPQTVREQFKFNTLSVDLSADKLHLRRGESTTLHVNVRGLDSGIDTEMLALDLRSVTPMVRFNSTGGEMVRTTIDPSKAQGGVITVNERLTGINVGTFTILAAVFQDPEDNLKDASDHTLENLLNKLNSMKDWDHNNNEGKNEDYFWKRVDKVMKEMKRRHYDFDEKNRKFKRPPESGDDSWHDY